MIASLKATLDSLEQGKIILYPTDTVWGLGCDATDEKAVAKIYTLKNRAASKSLIILVDSIEMLQKYVGAIPKAAISILSTANKPTTIIYNNPVNLAANTVAKDNTIAIRIVKNGFCNKLIQEFKKPIVSTSANVSGTTTPKSFSEISQPILHGVDYIVNLHQEKETTKSSTILKIEGNNIVVLRE